MTKRLLITIGVHKPKGMDELPGVDKAVARMAAYAKANETYDDPIIFSDQTDGVTADVIRNRLTDDLLKNRPRIVVHFCGHGAQLNGSEIWYLSDGHEQWFDRVDVMQFRDMVLSYGAKQVCIFSDACQTPASDQASGTPLLPKGDRLRTKFKVDMFRATIQGKPAFATTSDGPLFSSTVLEALEGNPTPHKALDKQYLAAGKCIVSSQSLATYVEDRLPDEAAGVRKSQYAQMAPGLVYDNDDYLVLPADIAAIATPELGGGLPDIEALLAGQDNPHIRYSDRYSDETRHADVRTRLDASLSEWRQDFWSQAIVAAEEALDFGRLIVLAKGDFDENVMRVRLHAPGVSPIEGQPLKAHNYFGGTFFGFDVWKDMTEMHPAGVLQVGDFFAPMQLGVSRYLSMLVSFQVPDSGSSSPRSFGLDALGWHEVGFSDEPLVKVHPMQALKGLMTGALGPESIGLIAAEMRLRKHSDPLYGIVAAYLYDRSGDTDSIRRMCSYYARNDQKVPFDIAMLSRLSFRKTHAGFEIDVPKIEKDAAAKDLGMPDYVWSGMPPVKALSVSGFAPVLRMGWSRMETLLDPIDPLQALASMRNTSANSYFPAFHGNALGHNLVDHMEELYSL